MRVLKIPILYIFFSIFLRFVAVGQSENMSLETCIKYALENNKNIQNAKFDEYIAQKEVGIVKAQGFPQITGSGQLLNNFQLPVFVFPGPNGELQPVSFGLPWQLTFGGQINQLIFDGRYFLGLRAARTFVDLSTLSLQRSREEVAYLVSKAFYTALQAQEQLQLIEINIQRLRDTYNVTKALNEQGFAEKLDVDRLEIALNNLQTDKENISRFATLSKDLLKFQMGKPLSDDFTLEDKLDVLDPDPATVTVFDSFRVENRTEYSLLQTQKELELFNLKSFKVGFIPSLYGTLNYSWNRLWDSDFNFSYKAGLVGLQLNIPIFDGGIKSKSIQKSQLALKKIDNQIALFEQGAQLELRQAVATVNNSYNVWSTQLKNKNLATEVYKVTTTKYSEGVGSNLEVIESDSQLKTAEFNYVNSVYDYILARIDLKKALGGFSIYNQ